MEGLGKRLELARRTAGFTQTDVAKRMCVSISTIHCWENDKNEPCLEALYGLANLYGTTIVKILKPLDLNKESALENIHEAARLLSATTDTDVILDLVEKIRRNTAYFLKEKYQEFMADEAR